MPSCQRKRCIYFGNTCNDPAVPTQIINRLRIPRLESTGNHRHCVHQVGFFAKTSLMNVDRPLPS